jgi:hypothetical protein
VFDAAGPGRFVTGMREALAVGVASADNRTEDFAGH